MLRTRVRNQIPKGSKAVPILRSMRAAAHYAVDKATTVDAISHTRQAIRAGGLGRLAGAVAATSSLKKRDFSGAAWGAIYARGGPKSRAAGALAIYSSGGTILPVGGNQWLWFQTDALQRRIGRRRMTPALYNRSGLVHTMGPLQFIRVNGRSARLIIRGDFVVSRRTKRAKPFGQRVPRGATRQKDIVAFIGIKVTRRAQRFNQDRIMSRDVLAIPGYVREYQREHPSA